MFGGRGERRPTVQQPVSLAQLQILSVSPRHPVGQSCRHSSRLSLSSSSPPPHRSSHAVVEIDADKRDPARQALYYWCFVGIRLLPCFFRLLPTPLNFWSEGIGGGDRNRDPPPFSSDGLAVLEFGTRRGQFTSPLPVALQAFPTSSADMSPTTESVACHKDPELKRGRGGAFKSLSKHIKTWIGSPVLSGRPCQA